MPRKRGAQPGNTNALRHGFYSENLRDAEHADLDLTLTDALDSEINLVRVIIRRTALFSEGVNDLKDAVTLLNSISTSAQHLSGLIYKRYLISGNQDTRIANALNDALDILRAEHFFK